MEQIENKMVVDSCWNNYKTQKEIDADYDAYLEEQDEIYEDKVFEEMEGK